MNKIKRLLLATLIAISCTAVMTSLHAAEHEALIRQLEAGKISYPERTADIQLLNSYLENGQFDMVEFVAKRIIEQQKNLTDLQSNGLPAELEAKIRQIESGKVDYPERLADTEQLNSYLKNGRFDMVAFLAKRIIEKQQSLASSTDNGLPAELEAQIRQIKASKIDYPERAADIQRLNSYLENGRFDMVDFLAKKIIEKQRSLAGSKGSGLPAELEDQIGQIESGKIHYPERVADIQRLNDYLENGRFDMVDFVAKKIIEQQENLRLMQSHGLPVELKDQIHQIEAGRVNYPERSADIQRLNDYLANGQFDMVAFSAKKIIQKQENLNSLR